MKTWHFCCFIGFSTLMIATLLLVGVVGAMAMHESLGRMQRAAAASGQAASTECPE